MARLVKPQQRARTAKALASTAWVAQAISHLSWPSSRAMYSVPVVVAVMVCSPSARKQESYLTETCTTSDTSLPTWYQTTRISDRPSQRIERMARQPSPIFRNQVCVATEG